MEFPPDPEVRGAEWAQCLRAPGAVAQSGSLLGLGDCVYLAVCALQGDGAFALTNYRPKCVAGQKGNQHPLHPPVPLLTGDNQGRERGRKLSYSSGPRYRVVPWYVSL